MGFREMRGGDGVSDVEIRRNEIIELLYTYKKYSIDDFAIVSIVFRKFNFCRSAAVS